MTSALVVLRTSVLFLVAMLLMVWLYLGHTTRLTADAAAQAAAAAAVSQVPADWECDPTHPSLARAQHKAYQAVQARLSEARAQPKTVVVSVADCNVVARVAIGGISARFSALERTATACSAPDAGGPLAVVGKC